MHRAAIWTLISPFLCIEDKVAVCHLAYLVLLILLSGDVEIYGSREGTSDFRLQTLVPSFANSQHCFCEAG
jgi:hypothetical protein